MKEDEILHVYERDDDWILVASPTEEGRVGYVPGNYVEEVCAIDCIPHLPISTLDNPPGDRRGRGGSARSRRCDIPVLNRRAGLGA